MTEEWSIEQELQKATGTEDWREALVQLGLVGSKEDDFDIVELAPWRRGGAETYIYEFEIRTSSTTTRLVAKACVASPAAGPLESVLEEWIRRRELLAQHGVSVPHIYTAHRATIVEEFIPLTLIEAASVGITPALLARMGHTVGVLTRLGFPVVSLHDLRSRGDDVVWVDFGQDLGPPGLIRVGSAAILDDLLHHLEASGIELTGGDLQAISNAFEGALLET